MTLNHKIAKVDCFLFMIIARLVNFFFAIIESTISKIDCIHELTKLHVTIESKKNQRKEFAIREY